MKIKVKIFFNERKVFFILRLNYRVSIIEYMGVVANKPHPFHNIAPRSPLLDVLEITPDSKEHIFLGCRNAPCSVM